MCPRAENANKPVSKIRPISRIPPPPWSTRNLKDDAPASMTGLGRRMRRGRFGQREHLPDLRGKRPRLDEPYELLEYRSDDLRRLHPRSPYAVRRGLLRIGHARDAHENPVGLQHGPRAIHHCTA